MKTPVIAIIALLGWPPIVLACPACDDPSSAAGRFDLVSILLVAGSLVFIVRAVARSLLRRRAAHPSDANSIQPSNNIQ